MGYGLEVDAIRIAHELDLLTAPYVFDDDDATAMAEAGADVLVPHMGLTTGGSIGADTAKTLDDCVPLIQGMHDAAKRVNPDVIVLCHGGPIAEPDDAAYVLERTEGVVGFFGASSMERLPTEVAMTENMQSIQVDSDEGGGLVAGAFKPGSSLTRDQHDWGVFAQVSGPRDGLAGIVAIEATFLPGKCHDFHRHPGQEEVIYVIEGTIEQWVSIRSRC